MKKPLTWIFFLAVSSQAQVLDVNGDDTVGAEEALAVAEIWKGTATAPNDHNHLGQRWDGDRNPLRIRGNFPDTIRTFPFPKEGSAKGGLFSRTPNAPVILDNTSTLGHALIARSVGTGVYASGGLNDQQFFIPDVVLGGNDGIIAATEENSSRLAAISNRNILLWIDEDGDDDALLEVLSGPGPAPKTLLTLNENGQLFVNGQLINKEADHITNPTNKFSGQKNVYDGLVRLDEKGEAEVELPTSVEAQHQDFRYQLTALDSPAPNLHVSRRIQNSRFTISGGTPGMEVSWEVTSIRQDADVKAHPLKVDEKILDGEDVD